MLLQRIYWPIQSGRTQQAISIVIGNHILGKKAVYVAPTEDMARAIRVSLFCSSRLQTCPAVITPRQLVGARYDVIVLDDCNRMRIGEVERLAVKSVRDNPMGKVWAFYDGNGSDRPLPVAA